MPRRALAAGQNHLVDGLVGALGIVVKEGQVFDLRLDGQVGR
jgi:hypothetical protein